MKIAHNTMVSMHYTLTSDEGTVIDSSEGRAPLDYVQGQGMIVPGLEKAMIGHDVGDKFKVQVSPAEGYGERDEAMMREFPLNVFQTEGKVEAGMTFYAETPNGPVGLNVVKVDGDKVTVDLNHQLAGKNLNFEVEVVEVRTVSEEELEQMQHHCGCGCGDDKDDECGCGGGDECKCHDENHEKKENCDGNGGCGCKHHDEHHHH